MKKRLRQILSLLCIFALALGCVTTAALAEEQTEARIIAVQWEDGNSNVDQRPAFSVSYGEHTATLSAANQWKDEIQVKADDPGTWTCPTSLEGYSVVKSEVGPVTVLIIRPSKATTFQPVSASVVWEDGNNAKGARP